MNNCRIIFAALTLLVIDVGLNTLTVYLARKENFDQQISNYSFGQSTIDLVLPSYLRFCLVVGFLLGILRGKQEGVKRLKSIQRTVVNFSVALSLIAAVKLLYFAEDSKAELENDASVKAVFCIALFSNVTLYFQWLLMQEVKFGASTLHCVVNEEALDLERESLLSDTSDGSSRSDSANGGDDDSNSGDNDDNDEQKSKKRDRSINSSIWKLLKYSKPDAGFIFLGFVFLLIASVCDIVLPFCYGQAIDAIAIRQSYPMFKKYIILMVVISLGASVAGGLRGATFTYVMARFTIRIQNFLFQHIMAQEIGFFDSRRTGSIVSRLSSDTTKMGDQISLNLNVFLRSCIRIAGILVFMAKLSWKLTITTIIGTPILVMISEVFGKYFEKVTKMVQDSLAVANEAAEESISSIRTVRSFAAENTEIRRFSSRLKKTFKLKVKEAIAFGGYHSSTEICFLAMEVVVLFYGGHLVMKGDLSGGYLISYTFYSFELSSCIEDIGDIFTGLMEAVGASHKVFSYIEREPKIKNDGTVIPREFKGRIEFQNVSFCYPSRPDLPVLDNISFTVEPGEIIALVGPSGSGKSTIVKLLQHFYEANVGSILIDGTPVQDFDHHFIHNRMALVAQEPTLFARSIVDNIKYGMEDVDDERIKEVAKQSNAHDFITEMPEGYDTETGEKGVQLSGGQKQRVAIARALIRNPSILILDEATSALDADSEYLVQEAINHSLADRTVVIVAHRLSTIEAADKILVIDKGCVMEQGRHQELLQRDGIYARLVNKQLHGKDQNGSSLEPCNDMDEPESLSHRVRSDSKSSNHSKDSQIGS